MPVPSSFDYAVVRVVPRVERGEFINAGVIVFCLERRFLEARVIVDEPRLRALWPQLDVEINRVRAKQRMDHVLRTLLARVGTLRVVGKMM